MTLGSEGNETKLLLFAAAETGGESEEGERKGEQVK